jgi:Holliday junction DNA helicase RuvA
MISTLSGKITHVFNNSVILEVGGIGYKIFLTPIFLAKLKEGEATKIFTHEYLKEETHDLYGFENMDDLRIFWSLLGVSGVGPKMAVKIMALGAEKVKNAISRGEVAVLSSVSGVGKKTAQKIILELKGELVETKKEDNKTDEVIDALVKLGYSRKEAFDAVSALPENLEKTEERLKMALKNLGRK